MSHRFKVSVIDFSEIMISDICAGQPFYVNWFVNQFGEVVTEVVCLSKQYGTDLGVIS